MDIRPFPSAPVPLDAIVPPSPTAAVCPLCHTTSARLEATSPGDVGSWQCSRCLQSWSALRLETVAAYERLTF